MRDENMQARLIVCDFINTGSINGREIFYSAHILSNYDLWYPQRGLGVGHGHVLRVFSTRAYAEAKVTSHYINLFKYLLAVTGKRHLVYRVHLSAAHPHHDKPFSRGLIIAPYYVPPGVIIVFVIPGIGLKRYASLLPFPLERASAFIAESLSYM